MKPKEELKLTQFLKMARFFFAPHKWKMLFLASIMFITGLLETLNLLVLYPLVNYSLEQKSKGRILEFFDQIVIFSQTENVFLFYCYLLTIIAVITTCFKIYVHFVSFNLFRNLSNSLYKAIFEKYLTVDYNFFVNNQQGKLIHTGTIASDGAANLIIQSIKTLSDLFRFILLLSSLLFLSWQGTLLIIAIGIVYASIVKTVMRRITYPYANKEAFATREKNVIFNELVSGIKTIKIYLGSILWRKKYDKAVKEQTDSHFKTMMGRVIPESVIYLMLFMVIAGSGIAIDIISQGHILPLIPLFVTFGLIATRIAPGANVLGNGIMGLVSSLPYTKIVYDLFHDNPTKVGEGEKTLKVFEKELSFKDICFKYTGTKSPLFEGISFTIEKKTTTAIVGSSGNGKSTLINLLFRLYPLDKGCIMIDGVDITNYTMKSYLSKIGYVSQETFIYNTTVKENIRFGLTNCTDEMIVESAKLANAHDFIVETQDGYETIVGDAGIKLSGGQRQRIAIARAMLRKPEIMILDEATSSLDNISEKKVQDAINQLSKHTTVLIIAHRLSTIINADKILVLSEGKIVEEGQHQELLDMGEMYFRLYNMQLENNISIVN